MMLLLCSLLIFLNAVLIALLVSLAKAYPRQVQRWLTTLRWRGQRWLARVAVPHREAKALQGWMLTRAADERAALAADVAELGHEKQEVQV